MNYIFDCKLFSAKLRGRLTTLDGILQSIETAAESHYKLSLYFFDHDGLNQSGEFAVLYQRIAQIPFTRVIGKKQLRKLPKTLSFLFLADQSLEEELKKDNFFVISPESSEDLWRTLTQTKLGIAKFYTESKYYLRSWLDLKRYSAAVSYLLIVDRFAFKNRSRIQANIIPLLDGLLKATDHLRTDIIILTSPTDSEFTREEILEDYMTLFCKVKTIRVVFLADKINHKLGFNFHDRLIITDRYVIESPSGFDLFGTNETGQQLKKLPSKIYFEHLIFPDTHLPLIEYFKTIDKLLSQHNAQVPLPIAEERLP